MNKTLIQPQTYIGLNKNHHAFYMYKLLKSDDIINHVANSMGLNPEYIKSSSRKRKIVIARIICIYVIRKKNNITLKQIGEIFSRDHSTIIYNLETFDDMVKTKNKEFIKYLSLTFPNYL